MITEARELPPAIIRYTAQQLAEILGISVFSLQRYRSEGTDPDYEKIGNRIFYRADVVEAWRQSTGRSSTSDIPSDNTGATEKKDETPWHLR